MINRINQINRRVILCVGPGGVGKTTCAAALGLALAQAGLRVAVVTIDPSRRLAQALGLPSDLNRREQGSSGCKPVPTTCAGLDALVLSTSAVFAALVEASLPAAQAKDMMNNPLYQATVNYLGGALEYAAMAQLHMLMAENVYDLIILDTPPTANAVDFLVAPQRIHNMMNNPAAKLLSSTGKLGIKLFNVAGEMVRKVLDRMGGGEFITMLGQFLGGFGQVIGEFERRTGAADALLKSEQTGVLLTTAPTTLSVREALTFLDVLAAHKLRVDGVILNRMPVQVEEISDVEARIAAFATAEQAAQISTLHSELVRAQIQAQHGLERIQTTHPRLPMVVLAQQAEPPITLQELTQLGSLLLPIFRDQALLPRLGAASF